MFSRRRSTLLPFVLLPVAAMLLSACGTSTQGSGTEIDAVPPPSSSPGAEPIKHAGKRLVLRVDDVGGFTTAEFNLSRIPRLSVYSDGTVLRPGVMTLQYPGPMVPPIEVTRYDPAEVARLVESGAELLRSLPTDLGQPPVADAPTTIVTVVQGDRTLTAKAEALGIITDLPETGSAGDPASGSPGDALDPVPDAGSVASGLTSEQTKTRAQLAAFIAQAESLPRPDSAPEVYQPTSWQVWSQPAAPGAVEPSPPPARPWPGASLPAGTDQWSCQVALDDGAVSEAVKTAVSTQPWTSGSETFAVVVRPLLPGDDSQCPA